jgi:acetyltransferase-like isoleucine patch superfamily enzyme
MGLIGRYKLMLRKAYFMCLRDGFSRANYLKKHNILKEIGENVYFYSRIMPSDPSLLKLGDNVVVATNVRFLGHDRIDIMLSGMLNNKYSKYYDCIEVGSNVFIGSDCVILPGVKIGDNSIIGAGAVVTKDLPSGFVWGGVPASRIGNFDNLINKRKDNLYPESNADMLWEAFSLEHGV